MTEDLKTKIFDWFTGNYSTESEKAFDTFDGKYSHLSDEIYIQMGTDAEVTNAVQITSPNGNNYTWLVLLLWNDTTEKGGFLILDENLEMKALIKKYTSGVDIGRYSNLYVDEEGRIYSIECRPDEERYRFIMLSNFLVKVDGEYKCDIRKAYNLPNTWTYSGADNFSINTMTFIKKIPNEPKYAFYVFNFPSNRGSLGTIEINVEEGNTIKEMRCPTFATSSFRPYIKYDSDKLFTFKILLCAKKTMETLPYLYTITELTEQSGGLWFSFDFVAPTLSQAIYIQDDPDVFYIDENTLLIADAPNSNSFRFLKIHFYDTGTGTPNDPVWAGTVSVIKTVQSPAYYMQTKFYEVNGELFCYNYGYYNTLGEKQIVYHILNKTDSISSDDFKDYILYEAEESDFGYTPRNFFVVQNEYNLYNYYVGAGFVQGFSQWYEIQQAQEIFNENNNNGEEYQALNSMIGNSGILRGSNNLVLFARNLYNKSIQGNKSTYSLEIPANMINDISILKEQLLSETKNLMNDEQREVIKNRFEELIINFINRISILNEDTNTYFLNGASRLNHSISQDKDYSNATLSKFKIHYADNTTEVGNLRLLERVGNTVKAVIDIYPTKEITRIDYLSEDENTIYNTIQPTLELNKNYKIKMDLHIE